MALFQFHYMQSRFRVVLLSSFPLNMSADRKLAFRLRYEDLLQFRSYVTKSTTASSYDRLRQTDDEIRKLEKDYLEEFGEKITTPSGESSASMNGSIAGGSLSR